MQNDDKNDNNKSNQRVYFDPLLKPSLPAPVDSQTTTPPHSTMNSSSNSANNCNNLFHIQTYTAGEDAGRLQKAAHELGLQQARLPRQQVRNANRRRYPNHPNNKNHRQWNVFQNPASVLHLLLETSTEDARMRSIYSTHDDDMPIAQTIGATTTTPNQRYGSLQYIFEDGATFQRDEDEIDYHHKVKEEGEEKDDVDAKHNESDDAHGIIGGDIPSAVLGIIKGMVGPAILYTPHGFASAGYAVAIPILLLTTFLFLYSSSCLMDAWRSQQPISDEDYEDYVDDIDHHNNDADNNTNNNNINSDMNINSIDECTDTKTLLSTQRSSPRPRIMLSYPELAYLALGSSGGSLVKMGIASMQSGVCLTYLIFVPQNLHASFWQLFGWNISPSIWLILMVILQVPLSWIRDIRKLTPTNLAANGCILYGLCVCLYFAVMESFSGDQSSAVHNLWQHLANLRPFEEGWVMFIGTSVLLFEGSITLLVPLQEAVETDEDREFFPIVYRRIILSVICFYSFFGITCWMAFGNEVRTVLTTSLPAGSLATSVQLAYSVAVIFTFPLQNFPALEITTRSLQTCASTNYSSHAKLWFATSRNFISSCLVIALAVLAFGTMNSLDKVVSLMGSLLGCPIAFVFPPLIHSYLTADTITPTRLWCNRIVAGFGVGAMLMASLTTIVTW